MAVYDITEVESFLHISGSAYYAGNIFPVDSSHLILIFGTSSLTVKTFSYDGSYQLTAIDNAGILAINNNNFDSMKIDDSHFIVAFPDSSNDGRVGNLILDGSYVVTNTQLLEHDTANGDHNSICQIDSTHYALAYMDIASDSRIKIFSFDANGVSTQLTTMAHDSVLGNYHSLILLDATHLALAYTGNGNDGYIKIFSINTSTWVVTQVSTLEHDVSYGTYNALTKIDDTHVALAYTYDTTNQYGKVKTFSIDPSTFAITEVASLAYKTSQTLETPSIMKWDNTHLMIINQYGIYIISFDGSYSNLAVTNSLAVSGTNSKGVRIDDNHIAISINPSYDGTIKIYEIENPSNDTSNFLLMF